MKSRLIDDTLKIVWFGELADNLVDFVADLNVAFQLHHVVETAAIGDFNERVGLCGVLVGDILHEQQRQDVVLVLGGVHAAAQLVAALPERGVDLGFLQCHSWLLPCHVYGSIFNCLVCHIICS